MDQLLCVVAVSSDLSLVLSLRYRALAWLVSDVLVSGVVAGHLA